MAYLSLNALEPVDFGGRECMPKVNAEMKLRLSQIKDYNSNSIEVLAMAFPDDEEYVKKFLRDISTIDIQLLHAYLLGGPTMVESMKSKIGSVMDSTIKEGK